ncbi:class I SAM-dependent methyltransferase [bacterium]|nr:class I SAM-dependent methyltransferase [bacterium]
MVIFVSSIGRSGTRFISNLVGACTSVPSHHLLEPHCHGEILEAANAGDKRPEIAEKIEVIREIVVEKGSYFESTPMFLRVLAPEMGEMLKDVTLIHLLRDPVEVARSYANRDSYPNHEERPWRLALNSPLALFQFHGEFSPFQQNLCDWLENELRFQKLSSSVGATLDLFFRDFNDPEKMEMFFKDLGAPDFSNEALQQHLEAQDLDRNANKVATEISPEDETEARELIQILSDAGFPNEQFQGGPYDEFWFTRELAATESKPMTYDRFYAEGGFNAASLEWLEENTDLKEIADRCSEKLTLLDIGCGDGEWSEVLSEWFDVTGVDLSSDGIAQAKKREKPSLQFRCDSFENLGEDDQFDIIFARAPSFLNHSTDTPILYEHMRTLTKHCKGRMYFIKYTREPFERWVPSRVFANFNTDADIAPDSKWYYHDPALLQEKLNSEVAPTIVDSVEKYFVAKIDVTDQFIPKPISFIRRFFDKIFQKK